MNKRIAWRNCKVLKFQNSSVKFWEIPQFQNSPVNFFGNSKIPKFQNSKIPKFQNSKIPKFQNSKIPKFRNSEIPKFQNSKIPKNSNQFFGIPIVNSLLEFWKFQKIDWIFLEFWNFEILDFWNFGILEFWNFGVSEFWIFWNFGILEFWNPERLVLGGGLAYIYIYVGSRFKLPRFALLLQLDSCYLELSCTLVTC